MNEARLLSRETIFRGRVIEVALEEVVLPSQHQLQLEIVHHPGGAAVVALDEQDRVCLLRQYRHAAQEWLWELPAGKIDAGEAPLATAVRELSEEAGLGAEEWVELGCLQSSPGILTEVIHLWMARTLTQQALAHEQGEVIEVHWLPLSQALDWCNEGVISDAKTLIGLYRAGALIANSLETMPEDPGC